MPKYRLIYVIFKDSLQNKWNGLQEVSSVTKMTKTTRDQDSILQPKPS